MKMGAWSALATDRVRYVGDAVAVVIAESQRSGPRSPPRRSRSTTRSCRRSPQADRGARSPARRRSIDNAPGNLIFDWDIGDEAATDAALARAAHITEIAHHQQPPDPQPDGAARRPLRIYDAAEDHYTLYTTSQNPHVARLVLQRLLQRRARAQAARDRAGRRRRLRLEDLHLSGRNHLPLGVQEDRPSGEVDLRPHRSLPDRRPWPRPHHHGEDGASTRTTRSPASRSTRSPTSAPTCRCSPRRCRPISTRRCCRASTTSPTSTPTCSAVYTNTVPVDAYRGAGRPEASYLIERMMETAARELGLDPAELRRRNFITQLPAPDAGHHGL